MIISMSVCQATYSKVIKMFLNLQELKIFNNKNKVIFNKMYEKKNMCMESRSVIIEFVLFLWDAIN